MTLEYAYHVPKDVLTASNHQEDSFNAQDAILVT